MTGYGKSTFTIGNKKITIEIKTLNSKQLDLNLKIPAQYRDKEWDMRSMIATTIERGKTDITISLETLYSESTTLLNFNMAQMYFQNIKKLAETLNIQVDNNIISTIVKLPDVLKPEAIETTEDEWMLLKDCLNKALIEVNKFRIAEGGILEKDFEQRIEKIAQLQKEVAPHETERKQEIKKKLIASLKNLNGEVQYDENRLEQELIYYLEKFDVTEEHIRLQKHLQYFTETISENVSNGKKLGFILQEIGREINTLGSKANNAEMQKIVVQMKDELEKMKEQTLNIL